MFINWLDNDTSYIHGLDLPYHFEYEITRSLGFAVNMHLFRTGFPWMLVVQQLRAMDVCHASKNHRVI